MDPSIFIFDNVISDDLIDDIKILINNYEGTIEDYGERSNVKAKLVTTQDFENRDLASKIDLKVFNVMSDIIQRIRALNSYINITGDSGYQFRKIHGPTRQHIDNIFSGNDNIHARQIRSMSVIIALNDDYEGGEICFPKQNFSVKLKKGQAIAFPPYWTHPHYTNELINGTFRYTINTWLTHLDVN
jgi:hypothetical protein